MKARGKVRLIDIDVPTLRFWFFKKPYAFITEVETEDGIPKIIGVWKDGLLDEVRLENITEEEVEEWLIGSSGNPCLSRG